MGKDLILSGTAEELKIPQAHKIIAAAKCASLDLQCTETAASSDSSSLVLQYGDDDNCRLSTTNASLRFLARLAPALQAPEITDAALVDGWLDFGQSTLDVALQLVQAGQTAAATQVSQALTVLDSHLENKTYLVGDSVTIADISIAVSLFTGITQKLCQLDEKVNLTRWYDAMTNHEWFALEGAGTAASVAAPAAVAVSGGVSMNGTPPPVVYNKYRRHRLRIKEVLANDGADVLDQSITVAGWARTVRKASSKLIFVELNDGSTGQCLQCVLDAGTTEGFDACKQSGGTGASFQFVGKIVASPGSGQAVDLQATSATLLGAVFGEDVHGTKVGGLLYPIPKKESTLEHLRDNAHLRPRTALHAAAMRIRHAMAFATHYFFHQHGFLYIHTPIITGADCEGAGEQFGITTLLGSDHLEKDISVPLHGPPPQLSKSEQKRLAKKKAKADPTKPVEEIVEGAVDYGQDFFGQRVNLTVSGQLNVETHACALSDVYTFGPTFRAEQSRTYRHLSEFWMIEPEIAFANLSQDMDLAEDYLKYCVKFALENCADDLAFFEQSSHGEAGLRDRLRNVLDNEFKRLTYTEAIEILQKAVAEDGAEFEVKPEWGIDLPSEHERYICEKVFNKPVVLTDYPKEIKAFYMKLNPDGKTVAAADVLVPKIGEMIGGSQREHRLEVLKERCVEMNLDPRAVWWYLDLRKYGTVPHSGFGLGFERLLLFVTGLDNIRDVIPFPRWVGNAKF